MHRYNLCPHFTEDAIAHQETKWQDKKSAKASDYKSRFLLTVAYSAECPANELNHLLACDCIFYIINSLFLQYKIFVQIERKKKREATFADLSRYLRWEISMIVIGILRSILKIHSHPHKSNFSWKRIGIIAIITLLLKLLAISYSFT